MKFGGDLPHETYVGIFKLATAGGKPVDTTGAGDCFRGSFVGARYGEGKSLEQAMKWAAARGATTTVGARTAPWAGWSGMKTSATWS